jgi:Tol biopolymer transport system component
VGRQWKLYRIRPDGSGRKAVGRGVLDERHPSFSPDGRLVVYVSDDGIRKRIYLRRFDGTGDRVLLESGGGHDPVW